MIANKIPLQNILISIIRWPIRAYNREYLIQNFPFSQIKSTKFIFNNFIRKSGKKMSNKDSKKGAKEEQNYPTLTSELLRPNVRRSLEFLIFLINNGIETENRELLEFITEGRLFGRLNEWLNIVKSGRGEGRNIISGSARIMSILKYEIIVGMERERKNNLRREEYHEVNIMCNDNYKRILCYPFNGFFDLEWKRILRVDAIVQSSPSLGGAHINPPTRDIIWSFETQYALRSYPFYLPSNLLHDDILQQFWDPPHRSNTNAHNSCDWRLETPPLDLNHSIYRTLSNKNRKLLSRYSLLQQTPKLFDWDRVYGGITQNKLEITMKYGWKCTDINYILDGNPLYN